MTTPNQSHAKPAKATKRKSQPANLFTATVRFVDVEKDVKLPFVPAPGTFIKCGIGDDFLQIEEVYLDLAPGGEGLLLFIKEPAIMIWTLEELKRCGWRECDA